MKKYLVLPAFFSLTLFIHGIVYADGGDLMPIDGPGVPGRGRPVPSQDLIMPDRQIVEPGPGGGSIGQTVTREIDMGEFGILRIPNPAQRAKRYGNGINRQTIKDGEIEGWGPYPGSKTSCPPSGGGHGSPDVKQLPCPSGLRSGHSPMDDLKPKFPLNPESLAQSEQHGGFANAMAGHGYALAGPAIGIGAAEIIDRFGPESMGDSLRAHSKFLQDEMDIGSGVKTTYPDGTPIPWWRQMMGFINSAVGDWPPGM